MASSKEMILRSEDEEADERERFDECETWREGK